MHIIKHFITITRHRHMVLRYCFRCGLYRQGLAHDLSKYSITEFFNGAKYYAGIKSPHFNERHAKGFSEAWMHHKGRNKHHGEYWVDFDVNTKQYKPVPMPNRYIGEMVCDRIAASKNYNRKTFDRNFPLQYFLREKDNAVLHETTKAKLEELLIMYRDLGEKATFKYIKKHYRKKS